MSLAKYETNLRTFLGKARNGMTIFVYNYGTTDLASLYEDDETTPIDNPTETDEQGIVAFNVAAGLYDLKCQDGSYVQLIHKVEIGGSGISGSIADGQVAVGNGPAISGSGFLTTHKTDSPDSYEERINNDGALDNTRPGMIRHFCEGSHVVRTWWLDPLFGNPATLDHGYRVGLNGAKEWQLDHFRSPTFSWTACLVVSYDAGIGIYMDILGSGGLGTPLIRVPGSAKGTIFVSTGDAKGTLAQLPIGADGQVLTADSAQTLGVKWA